MYTPLVPGVVAGGVSETEGGARGGWSGGGRFGNADGAGTGVVVGIGAGQDHADGGDLADVDRHAGLSRHAEGDRGRGAGRSSSDLDYLGNQAGKRRGIGGDEVRAGDGGIEIGDVVGGVAVLALVVVGLRQIQMVGAGGEVHVVVAGAAGRGGGIGLPVVGLGGGLGMTGGAIADVLRENDDVNFA